MNKRTWCVAAAIAALGLLGVGRAQAAVIYLWGDYWFESLDNSTGEPLEGSVSFDLKSPSFDPNDGSPDYDWKTLCFNFSFLGQSWNRFDVPYGGVEVELSDDSFELISLEFSLFRCARRVVCWF
jgi:hypothetical protein